LILEIVAIPGRKAIDEKSGSSSSHRIINMTNKLMMVSVVSLLGTTSALLGAEGQQATGPKQSFEVTSTERANFLPGGTIRLENSYGHLTIEGWDEPEVEVTVTKSTDRFYEPEQRDKAEQPFERVHVATARRSDKELAITTTVPARTKLLSLWNRLTIARPNRLPVTIEYKVHVPRDSRLVIHHDHGYVWVSDVKGEIEVSSHTGDMIVMLPDPGPYSIDARTGLGNVSSDFTGKASNQFLLGTSFAYVGQAPSRRVYLRMGVGSITIKGGPPSGPFWKN
jgi:hypothetical protein